MHFLLSFIRVQNTDSWINQPSFTTIYADSLELLLALSDAYSKLYNLS